MKIILKVLPYIAIVALVYVGMTIFQSGESDHAHGPDGEHVTESHEHEPHAHALQEAPSDSEAHGHAHEAHDDDAHHQAMTAPAEHLHDGTGHDEAGHDETAHDETAQDDTGHADAHHDDDHGHAHPPASENPQEPQ